MNFLNRNSTDTDWGFYIDIELLKSSFPNNEELLREKYIITNQYENEFEIDHSFSYNITINEPYYNERVFCIKKKRYVYYLILYSFVITVGIFIGLHYSRFY
jgi:hypothetical protein